ncbi:MAG: Protein tolB [uncultured bacterium]|nr:MAG: Protein tolB [uncultured bacterium]
MKITKVLLIAIIVVSPLLCQAAEIVFCGSSNNQFDLYRADLKTGKILQLTQTDAEESMPAVASDGKKIAFVSDRAGANSLYIMNLDGLASEVVNISAGIGAYANPCFSPDASKIAVQYAPDPEVTWANTSIVLLDPATRKQETIVDSCKLKTSENSETNTVVDRPAWVSESLLIYVLAEYSDPDAPRLTKSTVYMYDLKKQQHVRVAGGESYYNAEGEAMGFKAVMPSVITEKDLSHSLLFIAVRGATDRSPMKLTLPAGEKGVIELSDPEFFGPMLYVDAHWIYGTMNSEGVTGLAWRAGDGKEARKTLDFAGSIIYPAVIR